MRAGTSLKVVLTIAVMLVAALGYGYWHNATHATLYVSLHDKSVGRHGGSVKDGSIELFGSDGRLAARLIGDGRYGVYHITFPEQFDCHAQEREALSNNAAREAWRECFQRQARWVAEMSPTIATADIRFGRCELRGVAVSLEVGDSGWFLWWVPLPHVGGNPYSSYSKTFYVDGESCRLILPK